MVTEPRVEVKSRAALRRWLTAHHAQPTGVWLVTWKRAAKPTWYVSYDEVVEEALCFGWIDSQPKTLDDARSMRRLAPRRPKSAWSAVNKARVERLVAAGLMTKAGLAAVERAKADGSWGALDAVERLEVPDDLARALASFPKARENFDAFPRSSKRLILEWVNAAKRPETRQKRVSETARLAAKNERANHWRR